MSDGVGKVLYSYRKMSDSVNQKSNVVKNVSDCVKKLSDAFMEVLQNKQKIIELV